MATAPNRRSLFDDVYSPASRVARGAPTTRASTTSSRSRRPEANSGVASAVIRMPSMALRGGTVVLVVLLVLPARAGSDLPVRRALQAASVVVETTGCAGVVAENPQIIVTAKHCVKGRTLRVRLSTGSEHTAWVVAVNDASDQAVLFLEEPVDVEPLAIVRRRQIPGTVLYFEGNPAEPRFQSARLDRIGHCPSLPDLPDALFTSINGRPGDSGAPLVDGGAEIVGLVHGGARCHIATPAGPLARLVDHVLGRDVVETTRAGNGRTDIACQGEQGGSSGSGRTAMRGKIAPAALAHAARAVAERTHAAPRLCGTSPMLHGVFVFE